MIYANDIDIAMTLGVKARTVSKKRDVYAKRYALVQAEAVRSLKRQRAKAQQQGRHDLVVRITRQLEHFS